MTPDMMPRREWAARPRTSSSGPIRLGTLSDPFRLASLYPSAYDWSNA